MAGEQDEHLVDPHPPPTLTELLEDAGFALTQRTAIPPLNAGHDPNTYSAGLIGFIAAFIPGRHGQPPTRRPGQPRARPYPATGGHQQ